MKKLTQEEFESKLLDKLGPDYKCIGTYINGKTKIEILHLICNKSFTAFPYNLLNGYGCPHCFKKELLTQEQFEKQVDDLGKGEYEVLGRYVNNKTKISIKHKTCGTIYDVFPRNFVQGKRCAVCARVKPLTNEEFEKRLYDIYGDEWSRFSEYEAINKPIQVKHNSCGHIITQTPKVIFGQRFGCKYCKMTSGESRVKLILEDLNISYEFQKSFPNCIDKKPLPFDFYFVINDKRYAIEYDGRQHYLPIFGYTEKSRITELEKTKRHDEIKNIFCKENNIHLLRIKYDIPFSEIPNLIEDFVQ